MAKEIYKFLHGLSPPTMKDILKVRGNINDDLRNFTPSQKHYEIGS